jgi:hypothetical protein
MTDPKDHNDPDQPIELPPPKSDPGFEATDDQLADSVPQGRTQPTNDLDPGVDDEHLRSPSQGVRPEEPTAAGES